MGGGGAFPTPPEWSGVLTPGSISTITNDTYYNAWSVICRLQSGDLMVAYTKATEHHGSNTGNAVFKLSSNDGSSWGPELPIYSDTVTPLWSTVMGIAQIASGRIFATLWRDNYAVSGTGEAGIVYSDNDGTSWTAWIDLTNGFTQEAYGAGPVVELPGGDLLVTIEGSNSGQAIADRSSHTVLSSDNGDTWGSEVTVRNYVTDTRPYYESKLVLLDTGELIVIHRTADSAKDHYIQRSSDLGATSGGWSTPAFVFKGWGAPSTIQSVTQTLITITRRDTDMSTVAFTSTDRGTTWSSVQVLDATMYEMEYGCAVDLTTPGESLVVYGYQPTSSVTNSDIKQVVVTEVPA